MRNYSKVTVINTDSAGKAVSGGFAAPFSCRCMCCSDTDGRSLNIILP